MRRTHRHFCYDPEELEGLVTPLLNSYFLNLNFFCSGRFFLRHRFFLGDDGIGELHDVGDRLGSILTEGRLERQFSISDLG